MDISKEKKYQYNHKYYWKNRKSIIKRNTLYTKKQLHEKKNKKIDINKPFLKVIIIY